MDWFVNSALASTSTDLPLAYPGHLWDQMFDIWIALSIVIYLLVAIPIGYFLYRYRYQEGVNEKGADEHGSMGLEVLWTIVPLIVVIYLLMLLLVGFGLVSAYLKEFALTGMTLNVIMVAFTIQWYFLIKKFWFVQVTAI